ncbi:MAG: hypothetical protein PWQ14_1082 [Rikenellaceae bacterium]|nr:hypothetical protein [Rikenellaceae bacterium]
MTNMLPPYRIELFNNIASEESIDFTVFFLSESEKNRKWNINKERIKFKYKILKGYQIFFPKKDWALHLNRGVIRNLLGVKPDIIIAQYDELAYWVAFLYAKIFRKKFVIWNGSTLLSSEKTKGIVGNVKKLLFKNTDAFVTYGSKASEYIRYFGISEDKIFTGCNTVDVEYFYNQSLLYKNSEEYKMRRNELNKIVFVYSGQLILRKGINVMLEAFKKISKLTEDWNLTIIGDGILRQYIESYIKENNMEKNVLITGHLQMDEIIKWYTLSDVLILPSHKEVWGLVINEAMACGNAIICSDKVGAGYDLVKKDFNGIVYHDESIDELFNSIVFLYENNQILREYKQNSQKLILNCTQKAYAEKFIEAIKYLLSSR